TFTQSGGTVTLGATSVILSTDIGATGTYTLSGGSLSAANAFVGGDDGLPADAGVFTISGGTATFSSTLRIWNTSGTAVNLNSGTLSVGTIDTSGNPSRFHWTAGTLNITNSNLDITPTGPFGDGLTLNAGQTLNLTNPANTL